MPIKYRLKPGQESFIVMSGADEGKTFVRNRVYARVPAGYEDRFETVTPARPKPKPAPAAKPTPAPAGKGKIPVSQVNDGKQEKAKKEK